MRSTRKLEKVSPEKVAILLPLLLAWAWGLELCLQGLNFWFGVLVSECPPNSGCPTS